MECPPKTVQTVQSGGWLYLIHFVDKRHHAQHYLGSSLEVIGRLTAHANGNGARITAALWADRQEWVLARLWVPKAATSDIRALESMAKARHNGKAYCPLCNREPKTPSGCMEYPLLKIGSMELRK